MASTAILAGMLGLASIAGAAAQQAAPIDTARGWLGAVAETAGRAPENEVAAVPPVDGALLSSVTPGGPAAHAGLRPGDVVTTFGSDTIHQAGDLAWEVANSRPDDSVSLTFVRDGQELGAQVTIGRHDSMDDLAKPASVVETPARLGFVAADTAPHDGADAPVGIVVLHVAPGTVADEAGLRTGDVIEDVDQHPVRTPEQLSSAVSAAEEGGRSVVALDVQRHGQAQFLSMILPDDHPL